MFLLHVVNYNGLDSDSAVGVWNGQDTSIAESLKNARLCDNDDFKQATQEEIMNVLRKLRRDLCIKESAETRFGNQSEIKMHNLIINKIKDHYEE